MTDGTCWPPRRRRLTATDLIWLTTAVKELAIARLRHARVPVGDLLRDLRRPAAPGASPPVDPATVERLGWAVAAAGARVPWRSDCLLQAMAADRWLRRLGAVPEFFIGVGKDEVGGLTAHAWVRCDGIPVTGGPSEGFTHLLATADAEAAATAPAPRTAIEGSATRLVWRKA